MEDQSGTFVGMDVHGHIPFDTALDRLYPVGQGGMR